jgi:hypothetical protein
MTETESAHSPVYFEPGSQIPIFPWSAAALLVLGIRSSAFHFRISAFLPRRLAASK